MPLAISIVRGYTFVSGTPYDTDDLNAAALPTITLQGSIGASDIAAGSINSTHVKPGPIAYALTTGSANAYLATPSPAITALAAGTWLALKLNFTNTAAPTLNVNGLGAVAIKKLADQDLEPGDLRSGGLYWFHHDGTYWQLTSPGAAPRRSYAVATGAANAYAITLGDYAFNALSDLTGRLILFKTNAANTGACTLAPNGLAATAIKKIDGTDPGSGDLPNGSIIGVVYQGSYFQLVSVVGTASLPNTGPGAGSIAYPTSITLDAQGRVTAASAGSAPSPNGSLKAWATLDGSVSTSTVSTVGSDSTAETVEITAHGWSDGQLIWFDATTIGGTSALTPYYVEVVTVNTLKLHTTLAGAIAHSAADLVNITSTGASVNTVRKWVSNPLLGGSGVDGIILTASGFGYLDFTTAQASGNYSVSLSTGFDNGTVSDAFQIFVDTTTAPSAAGFKFCANTGSGLAKRVFIQVFA
jgi:hypothetical protein